MACLASGICSESTQIQLQLRLQLHFMAWCTGYQNSSLPPESHVPVQTLPITLFNAHNLSTPGDAFVDLALLLWFGRHNTANHVNIHTSAVRYLCSMLLAFVSAQMQHRYFNIKLITHGHGLGRKEESSMKCWMAEDGMEEPLCSGNVGALNRGAQCTPGQSAICRLGRHLCHFCECREFIIGNLGFHFSSFVCACGVFLSPFIFIGFALKARLQQSTLKVRLKK